VRPSRRTSDALIQCAAYQIMLHCSIPPARRLASPPALPVAGPESRGRGETFGP